MVHIVQLCLGVCVRLYVVHFISLYESVDTVFESSANLSFLQLYAMLRCSPCATAHFRCVTMFVMCFISIGIEVSQTNRSTKHPTSQQTHFSLVHTHTHTRYSLHFLLLPKMRETFKVEKRKTVQVQKQQYIKSHGLILSLDSDNQMVFYLHLFYFFRYCRFSAVPAHCTQQ